MTTMLNFKRRSSCVLPAVVISLVFIYGCRKDKGAEDGGTPAPQSSASADPAADQTAATPTKRHHAMFADGISPLIVSMSPDTVPLRDGHAPMGHYSLAYEIDNAEKATRAYVEIYVMGVGQVQKFDIPVQARGQVDFLLDASSFDLGPTVLFRAHCPYGDTDWFIMGSDPMPYPQILSTSQIGNVLPAYVAVRGKGLAGGVPITIAGSKFTRECTAEAQVDYSNVELQNVVAGNQRITAVLPYEALQGRPVVTRHLEVHLVVLGPGYQNPTRQVTPIGVVTTASSAGTSADIYMLNFVE
jgi:hypothetical protein